MMKLANVNMLTPKKALLTTMLATSIVAGASSLNNSTKDCFDKQKYEIVDKSPADKFVSVVNCIDECDTKLIDKISGNKENYYTKENKVLIRLLAGILMSIVGGMTGSLRNEKGKKFLATPNSGSNFGFISGFILPGITSGIVFAASVGILLKSFFTSLFKK